MATVAQLASCDGFTVEAPDGCLGWVEETWLDGAGHPAAVAVRLADGRAALLPADGVQAVDPDAQEVLVSPDATLLELAAPRIGGTAGDLAASWQTTGVTVEAVPVAAHAPPSAPALAASRVASAHRERALWQIVALTLGLIGTLIGVEIGLAFAIAYLVTGHPPY